MTKLRAVIIDDEKASREVLKSLLHQHCPKVILLGEANDALSGIKIIEQEKPDVVFSDININQNTGFKIIEHFQPLPFQFVFVTTQEQHAMKAYKVGAAGFLIKPIQTEQLVRVIEKVIKRIVRKAELENAGHAGYLEINPNQRIALPTKNGTIYLRINEIIYLQTAGRNTQIFLKNNQKVLTTLNLKRCEEDFLKTTLLRIHKSNIINLAYLKKYEKKLDACVEMEGGGRLDVGQSYKENLNRAISLFAK